MIDINLLNKKGVYGSNSSDFNNIDDQIELNDSGLGSKIKNSSKNDFESNYNNKENISDDIKGKNKFKLVLPFILVILIGVVFYYQFFNNVKTDIPSDNVVALTAYLLDNDNILVKHIKIKHDALDISLDIDQNSFNKYKDKIGKYFNDMNASNSFDYLLSDGSLDIKSSSGINIIKANSDKSSDIQDFKSNEINGVNGDELKMVLDSILNNQSLINIEITPSDSPSFYNITFAE